MKRGQVLRWPPPAQKNVFGSAHLSPPSAGGTARLWSCCRADVATPFRGAFACPANERAGRVTWSSGRGGGGVGGAELTAFDDRQDARDGGQVVQAADGLGVQGGAEFSQKHPGEKAGTEDIRK